MEDIYEADSLAVAIHRDPADFEAYVKLNTLRVNRVGGPIYDLCVGLCLEMMDREHSEGIKMCETTFSDMGGPIRYGRILREIRRLEKSEDVEKLVKMDNLFYDLNKKSLEALFRQATLEVKHRLDPVGVTNLTKLMVVDGGLHDILRGLIVNTKGFPAAFYTTILDFIDADITPIIARGADLFAVGLNGQPLRGKEESYADVILGLVREMVMYGPDIPDDLLPVEPGEIHKPVLALMYHPAEIMDHQATNRNVLAIHAREILNEYAVAKALWYQAVFRDFELVATKLRLYGGAFRGEGHFDVNAFLAAGKYLIEYEIPEKIEQRLRAPLRGTSNKSREDPRDIYQQTGQEILQQYRHVQDHFHRLYGDEGYAEEAAPLDEGLIEEYTAEIHRQLTQIELSGG